MSEQHRESPSTADHRAAWPIPILLVACLLPFLVALWKGHSLGPWDQIASMVPGAPVTPPTRPWDVLQADACLQFQPWRDLVFSGWREGSPTLYNPYQLAGSPVLANSQSGVYYPLHALIAHPYLDLIGLRETGTKIIVLAWLHLFIASLGVYRLARLMQANAVGAIVGGLCFALSPFMLGWVALASVPTTVAWIPWLITGVLALRDEQGSDVGWIAVGRIAIPVTLMLLAGHLQFAAFGLMAAIVVGITVLFPIAFTEIRTAALRCLWLVVGLAVGVGCAWPQLGPVLQAGSTSHRANAPTQEGFNAYVRLALAKQEMPSLLLPASLGNPADKLSLEDGTVINGYWPAIIKPGGNFAESAVGFGPIILGCLAMLRIRKGEWSRYAPILAVGIVGLVFAIGHPALQAFYFNVPGWSATGSPARGGVLWLLAGCVLAAKAIRWGEEQRSLSQAVYESRAWIVFVVVSIAFFWGYLAHPLAAEALESRWMFIAAGGLLFPLLTLWRSAGRLLVPLAILLLWGESASLISHGKVPTLDPELKTLGRVAIVNDRWSLFRIPNALLPGNLATLYRLQDIAGYDSIIHRDLIAEFAHINQGQNPSPIENGNMVWVKPSLSVDALREVGVTQVWSRTELPSLASFERELVGGVIVYTVGPVVGPLLDPIRPTTRWTALSPPSKQSQILMRYDPQWRVSSKDQAQTVTQDGIWMRSTPSQQFSSTEFRLDVDPILRRYPHILVGAVLAWLTAWIRHGFAKKDTES